MKLSIQTRVLRLLLAFAAAVLVILGIGALYSMERSKDFASRYAEKISNAAIENSSEVIISMRQKELLLAVEKTAGEVAYLTDEVRRDVRMLQLEMERIWADPGGYRRTPVPAATEDQVWDGITPVDELDQRVYAFITYAPGVDPSSLQEEIAVTSNIRDLLVSFAEQALQKKAHQTPVLGTKSGFLIKGDVVASKLYLEFRDSIWYRTAMEKGELTFTPVYLSQGAKNPAVACTAPYRRNGEVLGVIGIGLPLDELDDLLKRSIDIISEVNPGGLNFLLDEQGRVIFCQRSQREVGPAGEESDDKLLADLFADTDPAESLPRFEDPAVAAAVEDMKKGGTKILAFEQQGRKYTLAYAPVAGMGWSVGAVIPMPNVNADAEMNRRQIQTLTNSSMKELSEDMRSGSIYIILLALLLIFFCFYSGRKLSHRLVKPLLELRDGLEDIAKGNLDRKIELDTKDEIEEVADTVNAMTVELKDHIENIARITAEKQSIATELSLAQSIQEGILPRIFPQESDCNFDLFASMEAAKSVGGDFYDFYMLDQEHLAVTVADVSGKGIGAAIFMAISRTILKNCALTFNYKGLGEMAAHVNNLLEQDNPERMFVTVFIGVLDLRTGKFSYVSGGHNPPLIYRAEENRFRYLETASNFMLGCRKGLKYKEQEIMLQPGDGLFLYTDGVTEAFNEAEELYGEERLLETLNLASPPTSPKAILTTVRDSLTAYVGEAEQSDDITMLYVRWKGK